MSVYYCKEEIISYICYMDISHKLASLLDDLEVDYDVSVNDNDIVTMEFMYDNSFYDIEFLDDRNIILNGEPSTYKEFILNTF